MTRDAYVKNSSTFFSPIFMVRNWLRFNGHSIQLIYWLKNNFISNRLENTLPGELDGMLDVLLTISNSFDQIFQEKTHVAAKFR